METIEKTTNKTNVKKNFINPWTWQDPMGFSQGVNVQKDQQTLYCAGQASVDAKGSPVHEGDMRAQIDQSFNNLEEVLSAAGYTLSDVVRLNYYTTDINLFFAHYDAAVGRLQHAGAKISSTLLGVTSLAFPQLLIEIEATAVK